MFNPDTAPGGGDYYEGAFEAAAGMLAIEPVTLRVRKHGEVDAAVTSLGHQQTGLVLDARRLYCRASTGDHIVGGSQQCASDLRSASICSKRGPGLIRGR